jgi:hypothetical protein
MFNYLKDVAVLILWFFGYGDDVDLSYTYEE